MAVYGAVMASTSAGASVSIERASGWSRQLRLTPLRPMAYIVMKMATALALGALATGVTFAAGALSGKAVASAPAWVICGVVVLVGSLAFAASGLFMGYLLPSENTMQPLGPILAILSMLGGVLVPIAAGSTFDRLASFTPIYGLAQIAHWPLTQTVSGAHDPFHLSWAVNLAGWPFVFATGAAWRFRRDTARSEPAVGPRRLGRGPRSLVCHPNRGDEDPAGRMRP
ncbi:ABC transporter permease [Cellulomonas sp. P24]|uniref:ABC transporter permease n=1 Tax=Cellulomonas sp. P24 TaxID=2885206 RepID=UPI00216B10E2|nr:ABC transporter permease [Cellulomonas sp. P24]MCR6491114.1 ABC transporter permease [Cellulomonas sp. P24]